MTDWIITRFYGRWPSRLIIWATCPCRRPGALASWTGHRCDTCGRASLPTYTKETS